MLHGFRIVGKIRPSGWWPPYEKAQEVLSVSDALARAWEIRKKIVRRVAAVQRSDNLIKPSGKLRLKTRSKDLA